MPRLARIALAGILLVLAVPLHAASYKWVDAEGNVVYSQTPPPDAEYQRLNTRTAPAEAATPAHPPSAADGLVDSQASEDVKAIAAKSAEIRRHNCEAARKNLQIYLVHRRISDGKGNVTLLAEEERQAKIAEAQQQIAEFCD